MIQNLVSPYFLIKLEYTRGGRWRPACFFELAHSAGPGSHPPAGGGGGQGFSNPAFLFKKE